MPFYATHRSRLNGSASEPGFGGASAFAALRQSSGRCHASAHSTYANSGIPLRPREAVLVLRSFSAAASRCEAGLVVNVGLGVRECGLLTKRETPAVDSLPACDASLESSGDVGADSGHRSVIAASGISAAPPTLYIHARGSRKDLANSAELSIAP